MHPRLASSASPETYRHRARLGSGLREPPSPVPARCGCPQGLRQSRARGGAAERSGPAPTAAETPGHSAHPPALPCAQGGFPCSLPRSSGRTAGDGADGDVKLYPKSTRSSPSLGPCVLADLFPPRGLAAGANASDKPILRVHIAPFEPVLLTQETAISSCRRPSGASCQAPGWKNLKLLQGPPPPAAACIRSPGRLRGHSLLRYCEPPVLSLLRGAPGRG